MRLVAIPAMLSALAPSEANAGSFCRELDAFSNAPFDNKQQPSGRRWIEIHWRGTWLSDTGWGVACNHSPDATATALCTSLMTTGVPYEFADQLPRAILACNGYRFPRQRDDWGNWKAQFEMLRSLRWRMLEVDFTLADETGAIRYSAFADDKDDVTAALPPLIAMPPLVDERSK